MWNSEESNKESDKSAIALMGSAGAQLDAEAEQQLQTINEDTYMSAETKEAQRTRLALEKQKSKEAMGQAFVKAIMNNEAYSERLEQCFKYANTNNSNPPLVCGWDEEWQWKPCYSHLKSDT